MTDAAPPVLYLSPSTAVNVLRSAKHAWRFHSRGGGEQVESSDLMRRGKLFDRILFGKGAEIVVVDAKDWRTNDAKGAREMADKAGAIAVLRHKYVEAEQVAKRLRDLLNERGIDVMAGQNQHRVVWDSSGVPCKGFLDLLFLDMDEATGGYASARIYDLKIVDDASVVKLDMRASIQAAAYPEAIETLHPELAGRVTMHFIVAEADGHDMRLATPDGQLAELGRARWRRAVATWGECLRTGVFPGYPRDIVRVAAKAWDFDAEMDAALPPGGSKDIDF